MTSLLNYKHPSDLGELPAPAKLVSLQILRGLAACTVVIHHVALADASYRSRSSWLTRTRMGTLGASGVDLFFILSGFIMLYTTQGQAGSKAALDFLLRRVRRIIPLYWLWTTVILILWHGKLLFTHTDYRPIYIVCSYLLWPLANGSTFHPVLDPGWTLTFEMCFYLIFGLAIAFKPAMPQGAFVLGGLIIANFVGHLLPASSSVKYLLGNNLIAEFGFGVVAAYLFRTFVRRGVSLESSRWFASMLLTCGVIAILLTLPSGEPQRWRFFVWGFPCFCILLGTLMMRVESAHPLLLYMGNASYSIYLGHFLLVAGYATCIKHHLVPHWLPADISIFLAAAAIIIVSSLGYPYLEKPLLQMLRAESANGLRKT